MFAVFVVEDNIVVDNLQVPYEHKLVEELELLLDLDFVFDCYFYNNILHKSQ